MKNIVIIGAGDLGKELVWLIEDINKKNPTYLILGFLDDDKDKIGEMFYGYRVLGTIGQLESIAERTPLCATIAIRDGVVRHKIVEAHKSFNEWETIVHPTAVIAGTSEVNRGSIVFPHVTVSVETKLGEFILLYINSTICNNCIIGDYVSMMSGATVAERAHVERESILEAGVTVGPNKKFGKSLSLFR